MPALKQELKPVHEALSSITTKLATLEEEQECTRKKVSHLDSTSNDLQSQILSLALGEARIILLQDLSNKTLKMCQILKPLLEAAVQQGASYRWGYPFRSTFKYKGRSMTL